MEEGSQRDYSSYLNERNICHNERFCNVVKPYLSNKTIANEKITLIEDNQTIKTIRRELKFSLFFLKYNKKTLGSAL